MTERTKPPVSIGQWLEQVAQDPSIPEEFKNGAEDQLKLSSTTFSSGSVVKATESLRMRVIWHKLRRIEALRSMMTDDPNDDYTGYVSAENILEANIIFNSKRNLWQPYFDELKLRMAYKKCRDKESTDSAEPSQSDGTARPPQPHPHKPSPECDVFYRALQWQCLGLTKPVPRNPSFDELKRTSSITKPGPDPTPTAIAGPTAVNRPVTPLKPKTLVQAVQETLQDDFQSTPAASSYYPARGDQRAADESYINTSLLLLLQGVLEVGVEFSSMEWLADRLPFNLMETVVTKNTDTGKVFKRVRKLMEARVDGYLCRKSDPFEEEFNTDALATIEAKRYTRSSAHSTIKRQEGAEMACWISQAGGSKTGLLRTSSSGRKRYVSDCQIHEIVLMGGTYPRRLMISQDHHEIYIIVGEYGAGFEDHIRPSRSIEQGSALSQHKAGIMGTSAQADSSYAGPDSAENRRDPSLLAGSPSYIRRIESNSIVVEAKKKTRKGQPVQSGPKTIELARSQEDWNPDAGDFLIMNEFGPFIVTEASHMEVFIRRLIALMLQLRGPEDRFMPEPLSTKFLLQRGQAGPSPPNESSSLPRRTLRKSRSWPADHEKLTQDWVKPSAMPKWRG